MHVSCTALSGSALWESGSRGENTEIKAKTRRNPEIPPLGTESYRSHPQLFGSCIPELPEGSCCCVSRTFLLGLNIYPGEPGEERELESQGWVW